MDKGHWSGVKGHWSRSLVRGQGSLARVNGHWLVVKGQWSVVKGHWSNLIRIRSRITGQWSRVTGQGSWTLIFSALNRSIISHHCRFEPISGHMSGQGGFSVISRFRPSYRLTRLKISEIILTGLWLDLLEYNPNKKTHSISCEKRR